MSADAVVTPCTLHVVDAVAALDLVPASEAAPAGRFAPILDAEEVGGTEAGAAAAATVAGLLADGSYRRHEQAVAIHELRRGTHRQLGLVGAVPVHLVDDGVVRPHELTRADREEQLSAFLSASGIDLSPVVLAYHADDRLRELMVRATDRGPDASFTVGHVSHRVWVVVDDALAETLVAMTTRVGALTVIDGHHRVAAARRRQGDDVEPRFLAELVADDQLQMSGFDRRVTLAGIDPAALLDQLIGVGEVTRLDADPTHRPTGAHEVLVRLDGAWYRLELEGGDDDPVDGLPVVGLQEQVLRPLLGIDDPRTDPRIEHVPGVLELDELAGGTDPSQVLFVPRALTVAEVQRVAGAGRVLPPKSTFVDPKPGPAVFLRPHDRSAWSTEAVASA